MNYGYPQSSYMAPAAGGYKAPTYTPTPAWQPTPQVRPVSSVDEVKAYPIDFDGSIFYFPDITNKKIYTKSVNLDGTVSINLYELKENAAAFASGGNFVTREEFENAISQLAGLYEQLTKNQLVEDIPVESEKTAFKF